MMDKGLNPQSENLNFAVRADAVLRPEEWTLDSQGTQLMKDFVAASQNSGIKSDASASSLSNPAKPTFSPTKPTKPTKPH
jgi:hypothetical protein